MLSIAVINLSLFHIYAYPNHHEQESEFAVYLKTGVGVGVKLLGAGVDSESKILLSDHLCYKVVFQSFKRKECSRKSIS